MKQIKIIVTILCMILIFQNVEAKTMAELTPHEIEEMVGTNVVVGTTLKEYVEFISNYYPKEKNQIGNDDLTKEIENKIKEKFLNNNIELNDNVKIKTYILGGDNPANDLNHAEIYIEDNANLYYEGELEIKYPKEANYNEIDKNDISNKVQNIKYDYLKEWHGHIETELPYFFVEDLAKENITGEQVVLQKVNSQLNDSSIKVEYKLLKGMVHNSDGEVALLSFYKNNILYEVKSIFVSSYYGVQIINGKKVFLEEFSYIDSKYNQEIIKEMKKRGYEKIITGYQVYSNTENDANELLTIALYVNTDYNGQKVKILSLKPEAIYEMLEGTIENGKVFVNIFEKNIKDSGNYFLLALENKEEIKKEEIENPQTGNFAPYIAIMIGIVLAICVLTISYKNKKIYKI